MTVLLLFQKTAGYNQLLPLSRPLNNSRPMGALLYPCASAVIPVGEVSYTPFGTAETHQCPSLKQENSLIFGPWLPIHVFYTKATQCYTFHQNTIQLINFSVWTPFKMWSILDFNGALPLKKKTKEKKTDLKYIELQKTKRSIILQNEKKQARICLYHYSGKQNKSIKQQEKK